MMPRRKAKPKKPAPVRQVCTTCGENAPIVAGTRPRICVECFCWPPDPKERSTPKKKERHR